MSTPTRRSRYSEACLATARGAAVLAAVTLLFSTAATNVLLAVMLLAWLLSGRLMQQIRIAARHPIAVGAAGVICFILAATLWSDATAAERAMAVTDYRKLLLLLILIPLFDTPRRRAALLFAFLAGCVVLLAVSVTTFLGYSGVRPDAVQGAIFTRNHITHGLIMALLALAMATLALRAPNLVVRFAEWGVGLLALLNLLVMTRGRTGWVIVGGLLAMVAMMKWRWRGAAAAAVAAVVVGSIAYFAVPAVQQRVEAARSDMEELERGNIVTSTGIRLHYYGRALEIVRAHPILGAGTGSWKVEYERRSAADPEPLRHVSGKGNPHGDFVATAVQWGLVGLLLHVAVLIALWRMAARLASPDMWMARGLVVAYAAGAVFNSFLLDFTEGHMVMILLVALYGGTWPPSRDARAALDTQHLLDFLDHARRR
jgi:O-antigen ligase